MTTIYITDVPLNPTTGRVFTKGNATRLLEASDAMSYQSPLWATFKQWKSINRTVKKGEHGTRCLLPVITRTEDGEEIAQGKIRRSFTVFNLEQTEELQ
jgi:antirestriction protein ArdC